MSITVPPGQCLDLEITSVPSIRSGQLQYVVPVDGGVAMWFDQAVSMEGSQGEHFNWDLPASTLIGLAEVAPTDLNSAVELSSLNMKDNLAE